ncbi:MAG TPA: rRNA maturation RNase YbeY [Longimicrobiales bacterium]|nr:rRNA maturation RNase YbeY [Longimicrobiales bacterium]
MSAGPALDVTVNADGFAWADSAELERAVRRTLASQGVRDGELSLTLLGDEAMRDLNRRYLAKDRPTDVLAFALGPGPALLGDVYLGAEQARRQAAELGIPLEEELVRLAVHGTLHVLGHDHPEGAGREESPMFALQEALVREIRRESAGR